MKCSKHVIQLALILLIGSILLPGCQRTGATFQTPPQTPSEAITTNCIASYFPNGQAPYITQQQHFFNPSGDSLKVVANEPTGDYTFSFIHRNFTQSSDLSPFLSALPASLMNSQLAESLLYSFTAGAEILDTTELTPLDNTKIEGQWYQPLIVPRTDTHTTVTLLKNLDTQRIELVETDNSKTGVKWLLRSYNLRYSKDLDTLVPMRIDVFDMQNGLASKTLVIQIEYKSVLKYQKNKFSE